MKKRILAIFAALILLLGVSIPAFAENSTVNIIDGADLLSYDEWEELDFMAQKITREYDCGVYIVILDDYTEYGDGDVFDVTAELYNDYDESFGVGDEHDGIMLLLSMYERDWAMFVHGSYAEYAFNEYGQEQLEDSFLPQFGEDDWYAGCKSFLTACDEYLSLAEEGDPVTESHLGDVLIAIGVSCVIALLICLVLKGKMKTVHHKTEAKTYVTPGGFVLSQSFDNYTHTTETRRKIQKSSSGGSRIGGGGSGRSGKF